MAGLWWWLWGGLWTVAAAVVPEGEGVGVEESRDWRAGAHLACPSRCFCPLPHQVVCVAGQEDIFRSLLPPDTRTLVLEGFTDVPWRLLAPLHFLHHLNISGSHLEDLANLPTLHRLQVLDLSHNQLQSLGGGRLSQAVPSLTHLYASHNKLVNLTANDLAGLAHLQVLALPHNPLSNASAAILHDLTQLAYLDLSNSQLTHMPYQWFIDCPHLQRLNISRSALQAVPRLQGQHLHVADLSHNNLTTLPKGLMTGVTCLHILLLHHNPLQHVGVEALSGSSCLQQLDLSHTSMVNVDEHIFSQVPQLEVLNLGYITSLRRVEHGTFTGLHNLRHLCLSHTPNLIEIEEVAFAGLPKLNVLDLQSSGLTVLPKSFNQLVKHNTSVFLAGTALRCDCHHSWLPDLLTTTDISSWSGMDPLQCSDGHNMKIVELGLLIESLGCQAPEPITPTEQWVTAPGVQGALLNCNMTGLPAPHILWLSPNYQVFRYQGSVREEGAWVSHHLRILEAVASDDPRFEVLASGQLLVRQVERSDVGWYKCFAYNSVGNSSLVQFLSLSDAPMRSIYVESLIFGSACAGLFLFITLIIQLFNYLMDRMGWECCCCCKDRVSPKARQVKRLLDSVEAYKTQQLERLRENYNYQVVSIKDSCYQQMDRIRDSYSMQSKNLKDLCDYSTQGLTSVRDQYVDQVNKVRDYSVSQMNRVRENYVFQRHRIRKFSAHQLLKLRETYKYQQKTLNKILENLPDLYLQNCRTGSCQRTDSLIFDDTLHGIDAYYKTDFLDNQSHGGSDYYTPASTLTRSGRPNRGQEPAKHHSRTSSNTSSDFVEAQSWLRQDSSTVGSSPSRNLSLLAKSHNRSLSVAVPPPEPVRVHKRSLSASNPYHRVAPTPETRGIPARITLCEETSNYNISTVPNSPSSVPSTPKHLCKLTLLNDTSPVHCTSTPTKPSAKDLTQDQEEATKIDSDDTGGTNDSAGSVCELGEDSALPTTTPDNSSAFETSL